MEQVQTVVVGAGVIGLAIARKLARLGHEVLILEAEDRIALHTTSRNSGVIHAGIYYRKDSWPGRLCATGKDMLYDYCATRHVGCKKPGKLIVALNPEHVARLPQLIQTAQQNGVDDLWQISARDAVAREPELACLGAVVSPSTGIVDAPGLALSILGEAESSGAALALNAPLQAVIPVGGGFELQVGDGAETRIGCRNLINAAGLGAWDVARAISGLDAAHIPPQFFARGCWFSGSGKAPFQQLIYPVPDDASLGIHYTSDLGGGFRFGPDLTWLDAPKIDYSADPAQQSKFEDAVRRYWPGLPAGSLQPDSVGIRPKVHGEGEAPSDFHLSGPDTHDLPGLVQLFGIESPGLTCCLAIAAHVAEMLEDEKR
ncbi:MAG: NAD(P)/FAD-dependent oxidoreductase [Rhodobacteraceae bacterium]|nr:NAD(P)/FAD-dependent oxidoreductase [Paracoccaceae bacterium]